MVDPLVSGGVDQLSAVPTHAKRLALAAAAMGAELEAVQWRTKAARQGSLASRVTRSYLAKYYSKAYVIGGEGDNSARVKACPTDRVRARLCSEARQGTVIVGETFRLGGCDAAHGTRRRAPPRAGAAPLLPNPVSFPS